MRSRLGIHHVEAFVCVAEHLSFRQASDKLHMSQPALSRCIQAAEDAIGARLLDRDTRNVSLTPAGADFLPIARRLLSEFESSLDEVGHYLGGDRGSISIAALPSFGAALLPDVVCRFAQSWPQVKVSVQAPHSGVILSLVGSGQADIGLAIQPPEGGALHYEHLLDDPFVLVCAHGHPLASETSCSWRVFAEHPFIALSPTTSMATMAAAVFDELRLSVRPAYEMGGLQLTGQLIAAGLGISAVPRLVLPQLGEAAVSVVPLHGPALHRKLGVVTRRGRTLSTVTQNFLQVLRDAVSRQA